MRAFRKAILEGRVTPKKSLLFRVRHERARVWTDPAANAKLAKKTQGGRRADAAGRPGGGCDSGRSRGERAGPSRHDRSGVLSTG